MVGFSQLIGGGESSLPSSSGRSIFDKIIGKGIQSPLSRGGSAFDLSPDKIDPQGKFKSVGPGLFSSLSSLLGDTASRESQRNLAAVDAATAPFSTGSLVNLFGQGPGGQDPTADINEAFLLDENIRRRDDQENLLSSLFSGDLNSDELLKKIQIANNLKQFTGRQ